MSQDRQSDKVREEISLFCLVCGARPPYTKEKCRGLCPYASEQLSARSAGGAVSADDIIEWIAGQSKVQHCTPAWCLTDYQIRALKGKYVVSPERRGMDTEDRELLDESMHDAAKPLPGEAVSSNEGRLCPSCGKTAYPDCDLPECGLAARSSEALSTGETPRTDQIVRDWLERRRFESAAFARFLRPSDPQPEPVGEPTDLTNFARQLERELAHEQSRVAKLEEMLSMPSATLPRTRGHLGSTADGGIDDADRADEPSKG